MIKNLPEEEYLSNMQFKAHVINLMTSLNLAVENLNQPEVVAAMMNKLGASHARRKIQEKNFDVSRNVLNSCFRPIMFIKYLIWASLLYRTANQTFH